MDHEGHLVKLFRAMRKRGPDQSVLPSGLEQRKAERRLVRSDRQYELTVVEPHLVPTTRVRYGRFASEVGYSLSLSTCAKRTFREAGHNHSPVKSVADVDLTDDHTR